MVCPALVLEEALLNNLLIVKEVPCEEKLGRDCAFFSTHGNPLLPCPAWLPDWDSGFRLGNVRFDMTTLETSHSPK